MTALALGTLLAFAFLYIMLDLKLNDKHAVEVEADKRRGKMAKRLRRGRSKVVQGKITELAEMLDKLVAADKLEIVDNNYTIKPQ